MRVRNQRVMLVRSQKEISSILEDMTRLFFAKETAAEKRRKQRAEVQKRYRARHRETLLPKKRDYARREEVLARRRLLYQHRNDPKPALPPTPTLDAWAQHPSPRHVISANNRAIEMKGLGGCLHDANS